MDHINALERKGALDKMPGKARAVTTSPPRLEIVHVPIFGTVPAGIPELIEQQPDGFVAVDRLALGVSKDARLFATHVRGDSMIEANILDGDLAVFTPTAKPQPGQNRGSPDRRRDHAQAVGRTQRQAFSAGGELRATRT